MAVQRGETRAPGPRRGGVALRSPGARLGLFLLPPPYSAPGCAAADSSRVTAKDLSCHLPFLGGAGPGPCSNSRGGEGEGQLGAKGVQPWEPRRPPASVSRDIVGALPASQTLGPAARADLPSLQASQGPPRDLLSLRSDGSN